MSLFRGLTLLLTIACINGNYVELSELIQRIHSESYSTTLYFIGFDGGFLSSFMKIHSDIPVSIFTSLSSERIYNSTATLVVQHLSENHKYFGMLEQFILLLRVRKFVIISASGFADLSQYFLYFAEYKFTRIFGVAESTPYAYLPYANNPVQQLSIRGALPDALNDLNGLTFRSALQPDIPRGFWYTDKNGHRMIGGYVAQILTNFVQKHNATFENIVIKDLDSQFMMAVFNATISGNIDISMNAYFPVEGVEQSYPIKILHWAVMVPLNGYVHPNEYFLRPFSPMVWICIGLTLFYIVIMDVLKDISVNLPAKLWQCFSRAFLTILNMSAEKPITNAYRFHVQVIVLAFILVNLYCIHLTSFLTVFIRVKQYETIHDLVGNNIRVMMPDYEWDLAEKDNHPAGFDKIVFPVDNAVYTKERNSMKNTNFAYAVGIDKAEFLVGLQKLFAKPKFAIIDESIDDYYLGFLLASHSPFHEILNNCIFQIRDSGLLEKWTRDAVLHSVEAGLADEVSPPQRVLVPLTLRHLRFAWTCLTIGLVVAMVVFIVERYNIT